MKNLAKAMLLVVLTLMLTLPLSLFASAEGTDGLNQEYEGYVLEDDGYVSNWIGSSITSVSYAAWVKTDGQYNGCIQWSSNKDKVQLDSTTGVLTFPNGLKYDCKIYPAQGNYITKGGVYMSIDVLYKAPSATDDAGQNSNFSGMILSDQSNSKDTHLLCITSTGGVYNNGYATTGEPLFQLNEGWNTVIFYILPRILEDGKITNDVYLTISNEDNIIPDTLGITDADLNDGLTYYHYVWSSMHFSQMGQNFYMKPYRNNENSSIDNLSIKNVKIFNLVSGTNDIPSNTEKLVRLNYEGYGMSAYAPATGGDIVVAEAFKMSDGEKEYVPYWKSGEGDDMQFYKPGSTIYLTSNLNVSCASGSDLDYADLISAYSKLDISDLTKYNYQQIKAVRDEIQMYQNRLLEANPNVTENSYYQKSMTIKGQLNTRMTQIENRAWELIDAAAIFDDYNQPIDARVEAFEEIMDGIYDGTFSDECQRAINAMGSFQATYEAIYEDLQSFNRSMQKLKNADENTDRGTLILSMMNNLSVIRRAGISNFTFDDELVKDEYSNYLDTQLEEFEELGSMEEMYNFLLVLLSDYNSYKKVMFGERKRADIPEQIQAAVDIYNEYVAIINSEMLGAVTTSSALQYNTVKLATMRDMVADLIHQNDILLYGEEEEED